MGLPSWRQAPEAVSHQDAEAHAGDVKHALGHHEAHGEEEIGRWDEREDEQRKSLRKRDESQQLVSILTGLAAVYTCLMIRNLTARRRLQVKS